MLNRFSAFLDEHQQLLLTTHENPDGDGIGAAIGLAHYLEFLGKRARIVVTPSLPDNLRFLDVGGRIEVFDPMGSHRDLALWPDGWVVIDASEPHRLGNLYPVFEKTKIVRVCLDHHLKDHPQGFDEEFTDSTATASGELVYDLAIKRMPFPLPMEMANALYVALVSDTGNFRHSNSTPKVHRMAAQLIEQGVKPAYIYQSLYHQDTQSKLCLYGRAFSNLRVIDHGRFAYVSVSLADLIACGARHEDLDGLVEQPARLKGVEVAGLLYETEDGRIKVSLRSKERVDVNAICRHFGGGGHRLASGAKLAASMEEVQHLLETTVQAQIRQDLSSISNHETASLR